MKKLYKDKSTAQFLGVCSGIAQYSNLDVTLVRVVTILIALFTAVIPFIIVYIIIGSIMPDKSQIGYSDYKVD